MWLRRRLIGNGSTLLVSFAGIFLFVFAEACISASPQTRPQSLSQPSSRANFDERFDCSLERVVLKLDASLFPLIQTMAVGGEEATERECIFSAICRPRD